MGPGPPTPDSYNYRQGWGRAIQDVLAYPQSARKRGITGTVVVELTVRPTGEIERVVLVESSRYGVLDTAALEAVRSVRPRPFPPDLPRSVLRFEHTIVFELLELR